MLLIKIIFEGKDEGVELAHLFWIQGKIILHVPAGYDQGVAPGHGIFIPNGKKMLVCRNVDGCIYLTKNTGHKLTSKE